jgi:hypothetical protein
VRPLFEAMAGNAATTREGRRHHGDPQLGVEQGRRSFVLTVSGVPLGKHSLDIHCLGMYSA